MDLPKKGVCGWKETQAPLPINSVFYTQNSSNTSEKSSSFFASFAIFPMRKIASTSAQDDMFSKLKNSLFQMAFELCLLTGAQVCIIIFSPDGKPYSFGYPSVDMVANKFLNLSPPSSNNPDPHRDIVSGLIQRYYDLLGCLDAEERRNEKRQKELLDQLEGHFCSILGAPRHQLNSDQLTKYRMMLEEVSEKIEKRIQELSMKGSGAIASLSGNSEGLIDLNVANPPEMETSGSP